MHSLHAVALTDAKAIQHSSRHDQRWQAVLVCPVAAAVALPGEVNCLCIAEVTQFMQCFAAARSMLSSDVRGGVLKRGVGRSVSR